jgi:hypothetical protein
MFQGRLLRSTVHDDEHVTDCNHSTIQHSGEYDDNPFQTRHNNRHGPYRTRVHLIVASSLDDQRAPWWWPGMRRDGGSLRSYSRVTLDWTVNQQKIDGAVSASAGSGMVLVRRVVVGAGVPHNVDDEKVCSLLFKEIAFAA